MLCMTLMHTEQSSKAGMVAILLNKVCSCNDCLQPVPMASAIAPQLSQSFLQASRYSAAAYILCLFNNTPP